MIRKNAGLITLIIIACAIKIFSLFPSAVEEYYSRGFYPVISRIQRFLLGWIPFSIGDILYGAAGIILIIRLVKFVIHLAKRRINHVYLIRTFRLSLVVVLVIYIWFNISWGLNYNRERMSSQLSLTLSSFSKQDLEQLMIQLAAAVNSNYTAGLQSRQKLKKKSILFDEASGSYQELKEKLPEFEYRVSSVKPSIFSYLGNYLGFTGYYNPFTGEAQVNTTVPLYVRPFTSCHEIGHQLGFAKESEANFCAFLSARESKDAAFRYSLYFDLYAYGRTYLYREDSMSLKRIDSLLVPGVKADYRDLRAFIQAHENPVEVLVDQLYGQYLKANQQPSGRVSYNEVILLLLAYNKKYRKV